MQDTVDDADNIKRILEEQGLTYDNLLELQKSIIADRDIERKRKESIADVTSNTTLALTDSDVTINKRAEKSRLIKEAKKALKATAANDADTTALKKRSNAQTSIHRPLGPTNK